jgi:membrane protease YdiL (CAAX protease family)
MLLTIISGLLICLSLITSYKEFKKDTSIIKQVYLKRGWDYLKALGLVLIVSTFVITIYSLPLPAFLTWSWLSLFSEQPTNVMLQPFSSGSVIFIILFWFILSLSVPYLAKLEEETFRSNKFTQKDRIKTSIIFGLLHMTMGVNLSIAIIIGLMGYIYSIFYVSGFKKSNSQDFEIQDQLGIVYSTSIHAKYNFILITIVATLSLLACFY